MLASPPHIGITKSDKQHHPLGSAKRGKTLIVAKEANMTNVAKKRNSGKIDFNGSSCWMGVDVHKVSYG
jgi:hypothetical protein